MTTEESTAPPATGGRWWASSHTPFPRRVRGRPLHTPGVGAPGQGQCRCSLEWRTELSLPFTPQVSPLLRLRSRG